MKAKELEGHDIIVVLSGHGSKIRRFIHKGRFTVVRHENTWMIHESCIPLAKHSLDGVTISQYVYISDIFVSDGEVYIEEC